MGSLEGPAGDFRPLMVFYLFSVVGFFMRFVFKERILWPHGLKVIDLVIPLLPRGLGNGDTLRGEHCLIASLPGLPGFRYPWVLSLVPVNISSLHHSPKQLFR